nr:MAG TPA: hypothetical protein [Caudoviricetes sp.]
MFYICIQYLHDARGRRTRPAHQPESSHRPWAEEAGLGGMKAVAIRWAEQEAARKARKRPVRLVM